jgi:bla regulator protein blaR1
VRSIQSGYERHRAVAALVRSGASPTAIDLALNAAPGISSDYELASLLVEIASSGALNDHAAPAYVNAMGSMKSGYETRRALQALARARVTDATLAMAAQRAAVISSDYERAEALLALNRNSAAGPATRKAVAEAATRMSGYERTRVEAALKN